VFAHAEELGGDPARIAIGGESVGGNMATATCLSLKVAGEPLPVFQLLVYPVTQIGEETDSYRENADAKPLNARMLAWFADHALRGEDRQGNDYRISPLRLPAEDLRGLPPAHVITAEVDPLRDEGEAYAAHLREAGIPVKVQRYEGVMHEFFGMTPVLAQADKAMDEAAAALREAFTAHP
jgi:acetyl esterase